MPSALGLGGQSVGQDKSLALQDKLGGLDASIRNRGIDSQAATAAAQIASSNKQSDAAHNLGLLGILIPDEDKKD